MSPQIHPNGFRISDKPVAASFAHPYSFQPVTDFMLRDDSLVASSEWANLGEDVPVPHAQGREALAKATKDLMSLSSPHPQQQQQPNINPNLNGLPPPPPHLSRLFQPPQQQTQQQQPHPQRKRGARRRRRQRR